MTFTSKKQIYCPTCGGLVLWSIENQWRPFCTERCKQCDLGAWASEQYRVPGDILHLQDEESPSD
ncbi:DNA gyrase inhibitor YacG [Chitinimonas sp. BJB300]|uniref:DNA gyrase inhibitor YacG n=1 Tax=Chitinimonas sp. BJB300 TaxID=1559339 RepID=UPI000C0FD74D|nr:DNA gyrase inhibitor YacG [Chitinimonas sp. BJB300]PHV10349.1 DNA gyrase inhibitor YacG [Chitinimonas sp. BJB300]TSJ90827.1 DNA gyrase inhibitor YacG [Chitinimonas sp. BJB300]